MSRRIWFLTAMTALVALAAALRFTALGSQPLWLDEATTADRLFAAYARPLALAPRYPRCQPVGSVAQACSLCL